MRQPWKRISALLLSAALTASLLPGTALAKENTTEENGTVSYVRDTDGIDSGEQYLIYYADSNSLLYHNGTGNNTDQIGGTVSGNTITPVTGNWTDSNVLWTVTETGENGQYTVQNVATGYYLNLDEENSRAQVSEDEKMVTVAGTETYTITKGDLALCHDAKGQYYIAEGAGASLQFYKKTVTAPEPEPGADPPEIPDYTRLTELPEGGLDPSRYYLIVTQASDGTLYALYISSGGASVSPGALTGANGACTAVLTVEGDEVSAAYLKDDSTLDVDELRITVNTGGSGYTFRSGELGLTLGSTMYSGDHTYLSVSVDGSGSWTIRNASANRVLSFNKVDDAMSSYPDHITDFWGPRDTTGFPIYLYTQDDVAAPVDKSALEAAIAQAGELDENGYSESSWDDLTEALDAAQGVMDDPDATQAEVNAAVAALEEAVASLVPVVAPPAGLPSVTLYQRASGAIQAGDTIAVVYEGTNSTLYSSTNHTTTDQIGASISGDQLTSTPDTILWEVVSIEPGNLALRNQNSGKFLDLTVPTDGSASGKAHISDTPVPLTFTETESGYIIKGSSHYLCHNNDTQNYKFFYSGAESGSAMAIFRKTEVEVSDPADGPDSGHSDGQPFVEGDTDSSYFRIPSLVTLDNGWLVATADIRWRTTGDSPQNLDTIVSISRDGGETWDWEVVNYFDDMADNATSQESASFIDPSVVQASDGTVHMVVDACPSYCGLMSGNRMGWESSGFDAEGRMLVALATAGGDAPTDPDAYDYYVDINNPDAGESIAVDGEAVTLYPICAYADDGETGYYVDAFLDLYYDYGVDQGVEPVWCAQLNSANVVQSNLFYRNSQWKAYPVFYIMHRSATVTENGLEWSDPQFLDIKLNSSEAFTGVCPGRGTIATVDGVERILFPVYDNVTGEKASVIYSDDGGKTWERGDRVTNFSDPSTNASTSSESQIVVLPDGSLRMYSRNNGGDGYIIYADSTDGGKTWGGYKADIALYAPNSNSTMVSFINLDGVLVGPEGQVYENLILTSYPSGKSGRRTDGVVRIGSIDAVTHEVTWLNDDTVRYEKGKTYAYSCLTQFPELDTFGLLYEHTGGGHIRFVTLTAQDLLGDGWRLQDSTDPVAPEITDAVLKELGLTVQMSDKNSPIPHGQVKYDLTQGLYTVAQGEAENTWTVTPSVAGYAAKYDADKALPAGTHTATTTQGKVMFTLIWADGVWTADKTSVTIGVQCTAPEAPAYDVLKELVSGIVVKDFASGSVPAGATDHSNKTFALLEGTYSLSAVAADTDAKVYTASLTLTDGGAYARAFDESHGLAAGTHTVNTTVGKLAPITLTYSPATGTWTASATGWSLGVSCKPAEAVVNLVIYRDGNTDKPYQTVSLGTAVKGSLYDLTELDVGDYYTPNKFAAGYEVEGWYNDGGWNLYKAGDPGHTLDDSITINGWTNIICMVWDEYPVNYHIDGETTTTYFTARDVGTALWQPEARPGFDFDGWYEKAGDIGNDRKSISTFKALKKYELYGTYTAEAPEQMRVGVNYWDVVRDEQADEGEAFVEPGAWNVNSSQLTDIPNGYELVWIGDFLINDGWIWVEVRPVG